MYCWGGLEQKVLLVHVDGWMDGWMDGWCVPAFSSQHQSVPTGFTLVLHSDIHRPDCISQEELAVITTGTHKCDVEIEQCTGAVK